MFQLVIPPNVELFDVEGIPVSLGNIPGIPIGSAAWDTFPPRSFNASSARRNGAPISADKFRRMVAESGIVVAQGDLFFQPMIEFLDVLGVPVSLGNMPGSRFYCAAWDVSPPRAFDAEYAIRNGVSCSAFRFKWLIADAQEAVIFEWMLEPDPDAPHVDKFELTDEEAKKVIEWLETGGEPSEDKIQAAPDCTARAKKDGRSWIKVSAFVIGLFIISGLIARSSEVAACLFLGSLCLFGPLLDKMSPS